VRSFDAGDGPRLSVTGEVARAFGPHVIQIGSTAPDPVLIVVPFRHALEPGVRVEVTGRVRTFRRAELESALGIDFGADVARFEGARCLVASSLRAAPEPEAGAPGGAVRLVTIHLAPGPIARVRGAARGGGR